MTTVLITGTTDGLGRALARALDADAQAYDAEARRRLRELSDALTA